MKIENFEKQIQKIDKRFKIVDLKEKDIFDIVAIRFNGYNVCGVPSKNIYPVVKERYTDIFGNRHRTIGEALANCRAFFDKYNFNEEFKKQVDEGINDK